MGRTIVSRRVLGVLRVLILAVAALALFGMTALVWALPLAWMGLASGVVANAVLCGLVVWLFIAIFHVRRETLTLDVPERQPFLLRLRRELLELGYETDPTGEEHFTFRPRFTAFLFGGAVEVQLMGTKAAICGPRTTLDRLRKRFRLLNHVSSAHLAVVDTRNRGKLPLRRVQIGMRVPTYQWAAVLHHVVEVLQEEGAEVACEVSVLAHSEGGILDSTVEGIIRDWLRRKEIPATIHKEPIHPESRKSSPEVCLATPTA